MAPSPTFLSVLGAIPKESNMLSQRESQNEGWGNGTVASTQTEKDGKK